MYDVAVRFYSFPLGLVINKTVLKIPSWFPRALYFIFSPIPFLRLLLLLHRFAS